MTDVLFVKNTNTKRRWFGVFASADKMLKNKILMENIKIKGTKATEGGLSEGIFF